jgi:hypothetical protein
MAAGTEEGHGRAGPGRARCGEEEGCGRWGEKERRLDGGRRAVAGAGEKLVAGGPAARRGSRVLGAPLGIRTPLRGSQRTVPSAYASVPPPAPAAAAAAPAAAHKAPPPGAHWAPPPPNPQLLIGCGPRRLPGNAVPGLGCRGRKEEEASQPLREEGGSQNQKCKWRASV